MLGNMKKEKITKLNRCTQFVDSIEQCSYYPYISCDGFCCEHIINSLN